MKTRLQIALFFLTFALCSFSYTNLCFASCVNKRFYVAEYGVDKEAFERLSADVNANGGGIVIFPKGAVYTVSIEDDSNGGHGKLPQESSTILYFRNCRKVFIDMNDSRIILNRNHSTKYTFCLFYNCKSFGIENGTIIGDAKTHDYSPVLYKGAIEKSSHEWGHGIDITGSRGYIKNMNISYMTGDGIRISSYKKEGGILHAKAEINKCDISICRRNGITMGSSDGITVFNSSVHHIGTHDGIVGTLPQTGIDMEYEDKAGGHGAIMIANCHFYDCTKATITASNTSIPDPSEFCIKDSKIEGSYFQIANLIPYENGKKLVKNCVFNKTPINCGKTTVEDCYFDMGTKLHYVQGTTFRNCSFIGQLTGLSEKYGNCIVGDNYSPASFVDCEFKNIRGMNDGSVYQGFSGYAFKLNAGFKRCTFSNCSFILGGAGAESKYEFHECTLLDGCTVYNKGDKQLTFKKSKLYNVASGVDQKGRFSFEQCEIVHDDDSIKYPLIYFGNHKVKDCTIVNKVGITSEMKRRGVKAAIIEELK
jgi:hypothetical protein